MPKAMIVDDHPFIRSTVKELLKQEQYEIVAEADNGPDAVQMAKEHSPNLMILDISLPIFDGFEVMNRMRGSDLSTRIIVLTSFSSNLYCRRCINLGASGFVNKSGDLNELSDAIRAVEMGYGYFPNLNSDSARKSVNHDDQELIARLSNRELSILWMIARGASTKMISDDLHLNCKIVSTCKSRLLEKLNATSPIGLIDFAKRNDLI